MASDNGCEYNKYLWNHFSFNAEQRLKAFNFFVVFSVFANGGVFAAFEKEAHPAIISMLGAFVLFLSVVFLLIDRRSRELLQLTLPGLRAYEATLPEHSRLFTIDEQRRGHGATRYTTAFGWMFKAQALFGVLVTACGLVRLLCMVRA